MKMYKRNPEYCKAVAGDQTTMLPLFNPEQFGLAPLPRTINDASETKAEALKVLEQYLEAQQWDVYLAFKQIGPATDWDVSRLLGIERSSVCGRRNTLVKFGLVEKFDEVTLERGKRIVKNARWRVVVKIPAKLMGKKLRINNDEENK